MNIKGEGKGPNQPVTRSKANEKESPGNLGGRAEVGVSGAKRSNIDWVIEELKDHRGFIGKLVGVDWEKLDRLGNINEVENYFKKRGAKIPEEIQVVLDKNGYITEEQAKELKRLAMEAKVVERPKEVLKDEEVAEAKEGEVERPEKVLRDEEVAEAKEGEMERPEKALNTKEDTIIDYGPFNNKDMINLVMEFPGVATSLSSVSTSFRELSKERLRVVLTNDDLKGKKGIEKIKFALGNACTVSIDYRFIYNTNTGIHTTPTEQYHQFNSFLRSNEGLFGKIEVLNLHSLFIESEFEFQELLNSCKSLKVLNITSIKDIEELTFPETLTSFSCWSLKEGSVLKFSKNLESFGCWDSGNAAFEYPENTPLVSVNVQGGILELPESLNSLSSNINLGKGNAAVILPKKLQILSCNGIKGDFKLVASDGLPVNLISLRCLRFIGFTGTLPDSLEEVVCRTISSNCHLSLPHKLLKFACSVKIEENVKISLPSGLLSLSIRNVVGDDTFEFPDGIPQLEVLKYGDIEGENNIAMIKVLKENMKNVEG